MAISGDRYMSPRLFSQRRITGRLVISLHTVILGTRFFARAQCMATKSTRPAVRLSFPPLGAAMAQSVARPWQKRVLAPRARPRGLPLSRIVSQNGQHNSIPWGHGGRTQAVG